MSRTYGVFFDYVFFANEPAGGGWRMCKAEKSIEWARVGLQPSRKMGPHFSLECLPNVGQKGAGFVPESCIQRRQELRKKLVHCPRSVVKPCILPLAYCGPHVSLMTPVLAVFPRVAGIWCRWVLFDGLGHFANLLGWNLCK